MKVLIYTYLANKFGHNINLFIQVHLPSELHKVTLKLFCSALTVLVVCVMSWSQSHGVLKFRFGQHSVCYFVFASAGFRLPISLTFDPESNELTNQVVMVILECDKRSILLVNKYYKLNVCVQAVFFYSMQVLFGHKLQLKRFLRLMIMLQCPRTCLQNMIIKFFYLHQDHTL